MKKQMIGLIAGAMMCVASMPVFAAEKKVEIAFQVGDSNLRINGQQVSVETPCIVDDVTLVPVRVITEAFGAEVIWNEQDRSITIQYSDVIILLYLDSKIAFLNGQQMELLAAPTLIGDTTMIPLRFITENFGADVSYQEDTRDILVVKEMTDSNSIKDYSMILKRSEKERLGDSYLGWSMNRMASMKLDSRSFDGMSNVFSNESLGAEMHLEIAAKDEETTLDTLYQTVRNALESVSVQKLERIKTPSGVEYIHTSFKNRNCYSDLRLYIHQDMIYELGLQVDINTDKSEFDHLAADMDSFDFTFPASDTENLSDVNPNTNMHTYQSEELGIKIDIPGQYTILQSENKINDIMFCDFNSSDISSEIENISVSVYSKEPGHDAKSWADSDRKNNRNGFKEKFAEFSEVESTKLAGYDAYCYTANIKTMQAEKILKDVFFDIGDYFYNVSVEMKKENEKTLNQIFDSLVLDGVDADAVGVLLRTDEQNKSISYKTCKVEANGMSFEAPADWEETGTTSDKYLFNQNSAIIVSLMNKSVTGYQSASTLMNDLVQSIKDDDSCSIGKERSYPKIDKKDSAHYTYQQTTDGITMVHYVYLIEDNSYIVILKYAVPELYDGANSQEILKKLVESVKFSS